MLGMRFPVRYASMRAHSCPRKTNSPVKDVFLDLRALAVFRLALGAALVVEALFRSFVLIGFVPFRFVRKNVNPCSV